MGCFGRLRQLRRNEEKRGAEAAGLRGRSSSSYLVNGNCFETEQLPYLWASASSSPSQIVGKARLQGRANSGAVYVGRLGNNRVVSPLQLASCEAVGWVEA